MGGLPLLRKRPMMCGPSVISTVNAATAACLVGGALLVTGFSHESSSAQTLRMCVDRWNQGNMVGWGPAPANVAFRRPLAKEHSTMELSSSRQCIVAVAAGGGTWTCVLITTGAYWCPPLHEPTGPVLRKNARIDRRGVLALDRPLKGTHPTPPLAWQRYPHVDGFVEPWTSSGTLRPGLRFKGEGRGDCFRVDETVRSGISCLSLATLNRYDACFPQRRHWGVGDLAACTGLGDTTFVRWTITPQNSGNTWKVSPAGSIASLRIGRSTIRGIRGQIGTPDYVGRGQASANLGLTYQAVAYACSRRAGGTGLDPGGARPSHRRCRTVFFLDAKTGKLAGFWTDSRQFQTSKGIEPGMRQDVADRLQGNHPHVGALTGIDVPTRSATLFIENSGCKPGRNLDTSPCLGGRVRALIVEGRHPVGLLEDAIPNA
jgi:hypothetical protein